MGYTIKQKIDICWKAESNPQMTQADLALWASKEYGSKKPPSQTTISRILSSKNELIASKETEFKLVRRRKQANPLLRRILTEWITQATWENIPITSPVIQSTANAIWTRLPTNEKEGNGIFNQKWCNHFLRSLNINLIGSPEDHAYNPGRYHLNKVWKLEDKVELKAYLKQLMDNEGYAPQDIFTIDEFQLFYSLPLDQIFDVSSIDKGLKQNSFTSASSLTIMLGCNIDGSEKLAPLIVGNYDKFDVSESSNNSLKNISSLNSVSQHALMNKITETYHVSYKSNTNKWVTSSMFQNYLLTLEHKLANASPNRKIVIILDDSSSHRIINLKFSNIRLCFLKNNTNHKNPYHSSYNGIKFDYLPMNFGIVEEFKMLYRIQQYLEMINLQRRKSARINSKEESLNYELSYDDDPADINLDLLRSARSSSAMEVLSESDYEIPLIKVIEWVKKAWDNLAPEMIFISWKKTNLLELGPRYHLQFAVPGPSPFLHPSLVPISSRSETFDSQKAYKTLSSLMSFLNVVIPWEIEDLLGLVNERAKITLSYASIEEIIGSCLSDTFGSSRDSKTHVHIEEDPEEPEQRKWFESLGMGQKSSGDLLMDQAYSALISNNTPEQLNTTAYTEIRENPLMSNDKDVSNTSDLNFNQGELEGTMRPKRGLEESNQWVSDKKSQVQLTGKYPILKSNGPPISMSNSSSFENMVSPSLAKDVPLSGTPLSGAKVAEISREIEEKVTDYDVVSALTRVIEVAELDLLKLSTSTLNDLKQNLDLIQSKIDSMGNST